MLLVLEQDGDRFLLRRGALSLDIVERIASGRGAAVQLSVREFSFVLHLLKAEGQPVSRDALTREVLKLPNDPGTNVVAVHISRLRSKLRDIVTIETLRGEDRYRLMIRTD